MASAYDVTATNRVRRLKDRAKYDHASVHQIVDEALICHVGFTLPPSEPKDDDLGIDFPMVIPMLHGRVGESIYLHGYISGRLIKALASNPEEGVPTCITATLMDGLVFALNPFHNSMNYRSAVVFGLCYAVTDDEEKKMALLAITEKLTPGRWERGIEPSAADYKATGVVRVEIVSASAKIRAASNKDDKADLEHELAATTWTGVVPTRTVFEEPVTGPTCREGVQPPEYLLQYLQTLNTQRPPFP
ncbi:hypothetical protein HDU96_004653 [Phlyctochytrium bullatum]|nr:hypothetical protein HDU96_004653 [Phlyctochytrium bullatum]